MHCSISPAAACRLPEGIIRGSTTADAIGMAYALCKTTDIIGMAYALCRTTDITYHRHEPWSRPAPALHQRQSCKNKLRRLRRCYCQVPCGANSDEPSVAPCRQATCLDGRWKNRTQGAAVILAHKIWCKRITEQARNPPAPPNSRIMRVQQLRCIPEFTRSCSSAETLASSCAQLAEDAGCAGMQRAATSKSLINAMLMNRVNDFGLALGNMGFLIFKSVAGWRRHPWHVALKVVCALNGSFWLAACLPARACGRLSPVAAARGRRPRRRPALPATRRRRHRRSPWPSHPRPPLQGYVSGIGFLLKRKRASKAEGVVVGALVARLPRVCPLHTGA